MCRAVFYLRVSTQDETTASQERELRAVADRMAAMWSRSTRTMASAARRVDRLGRSLKDLVGFVSELHALKIDLFLHQQGLARG
jgi:DNA invertase Pin-like site-specific DNA recombinase